MTAWSLASLVARQRQSQRARPSEGAGNAVPGAAPAVAAGAAAAAGPLVVAVGVDEPVELSERERRWPLVFLWPRVFRHLRDRNRKGRAS